jgi:hypothetical protein
MNDFLTHYTRSIQSVVGILSNGFAWVPNRRGLVSDLVPFHDFTDREPQQFGMISFTELSPSNAGAHRREFGDFGVSVSMDWAQRHGTQKVLYVDRKGPIFEALGWLFQTAYAQLQAAIDYPDDAALRMAFTNKAMAGVVGGVLWAHLLQIYEYLEPIESSCQQEWRIVHPHPYCGYGQSKSEIIKVVSPPKGWAKDFNVLPVERGDVRRIVCPASSRDELRNCLPEPFREVPFEYLES